MLKTVEESRAFFAGDAFATQACGIVIDQVSEQGAVCSMALTPGLMNAGGTAQGGAIFTLCDTAFAVAANAHGGMTVSMDASISFLRPGTGSRLRAEAQEVSAGRTTCLYRISVYDDGGRLVAHATVTGFRRQGEDGAGVKKP